MVRRSKTARTVLALILLCGPALAAGGTADATPVRGHGPVSGSLQPGGPVVIRPGSAITAAPNWSGLAIAAGEFFFTSIGDAWTQPAVTCTSGKQAAAFWVGLDGYGSPSVEQAGTLASCQNGAAVYQAWYEMYPAAPVYFTNPVHPGDEITATVVFDVGTEFTITVSDAQQGWTRSVQAEGSADRSSAEVIVEAPAIIGAGYAPLANFGTASFGRADINGRFITSYSPAHLTIVDSTGRAEDSISETELGTLSVTWLRST